MREVLFIPGVGGHPLFHRGLLGGLENGYAIRTAPHGDFFAAPYTRLDEHVDYWSGQAMACGREVAIVAVSFGTQVVPQLVRRHASRISNVVLVSPWIQSGISRLGLRALRRIPERPCASMLSFLLRRWTDRQASDQAEVERCRAELYDAPALVAARWRHRILAMDSHNALTWDALAGLCGRTRVSLLMGSDEWLWRSAGARLRRLANGHETLRVHAVPGGHSIGTVGTREATRRVAAALE